MSLFSASPLYLVKLDSAANSLRKGALLAFFCLNCLLISAANSHPADEFCDQGMMDPLLCAQLADLDRAVATSSGLPAIDLDRSAISTLILYTQFGVEHILPWGLDHLAFVLALILSTTSLRVLLIQISLFTLAHSVTLALGVMNIVQLNSLWVELAIALSIIFVAIENLLAKYQLAWRSAIVFGFGLLHGLGFAGALSEFGLPDTHYASALIGFNLGVEIGQLSFALVVFVLLHRVLSKRNFFSYVFIPGNCVVALAGLYWLLERLAG